MRSLLLIVGCAFVAVICWGIYGPVLEAGRSAMALHPEDFTQRVVLRPLVCLGLAYATVSVVSAGVLLYIHGEQGRWTLLGALWSMGAGAAGAIGTLGTVMTFAFGGCSVYVMPLVFAGAPVLQTLLTIAVARRTKKVGPAFLAGLIMVVLGAVIVLAFRPLVFQPTAVGVGLLNFLLVLVSLAVAILSWAAYHPILRQGQTSMGGSRLRPLLGAGIAYLFIAALVPALLLGTSGEPSQLTFRGVLWSSAAGTAAALGALGIMTALKFGGKPTYIMPLVFGGAAAVNTFAAAMQHDRAAALGPMFCAGLILVIAGAVIALVFAPRE